MSVYSKIFKATVPFFAKQDKCKIKMALHIVGYLVSNINDPKAWARHQFFLFGIAVTLELPAIRNCSRRAAFSVFNLSTEVSASSHC
jgi:hypothetical protein